MAGLESFLKRKGPFGLPMPVVLIGGGGIAYYLYTRNQAASAPADPNAQTDTSGQGADASGSGSQPAAAFGPGGSTSYTTKNYYVTKRIIRPRRRRGGRARRPLTSASRAIAANR